MDRRIKYTKKIIKETFFELISEKDIKKIEEEIEYRKLVVRKEAIEAVKEARAQGDLSENFEYYAAKRDKNKNESRIRYLERVIRTAKVVSDESKEDEVGLYNTVEVYFEDELKAAYTPKDESEKTVKHFSKAMLEVFIEHKKLVKLLFNTNNGLYFLNSILEIAYSRCKEKWEKDLPDISQEDMEYASIFIFNGALGVINFWVQNDFDKDINEISEIIETLSYYGTKKYIYKK